MTKKPKTDIECPTCEGSGEVTPQSTDIKYGSEQLCGTCNGTGKVTEHEHKDCCPHNCIYLGSPKDCVLVHGGKVTESKLGICDAHTTDKLGHFKNEYCKNWKGNLDHSKEPCNVCDHFGFFKDDYHGEVSTDTPKELCAMCYEPATLRILTFRCDKHSMIERAELRKLLNEAYQYGLAADEFDDALANAALESLLNKALAALSPQQRPSGSEGTDAKPCVPSIEESYTPSDKTATKERPHRYYCTVDCGIRHGHQDPPKSKPAPATLRANGLSEAEYAKIHYLIKKKWGKASRCEFCNGVQSKTYQWANKSQEYKLDRDDWLELCASCHGAYDHQNTHCIFGHEYTPENSYFKTVNQRQCRECNRRYQKELRERDPERVRGIWKRANAKRQAKIVAKRLNHD